MAPKRKAAATAAATAAALETEPAEAVAPKRRKSSVAKPSTTKTAAAKKPAAPRQKSAAAAAKKLKPAALKAAAAKKGRASVAADVSAEKATTSRSAKRPKLAPVAEEPAAPALPPVEHPSHLKVPGKIYVLGEGADGQLGKGEDVQDALRPAPSPIPGKQVVQVAAGGMHSVALTPEGEVWTTGVNDEGALGRETGGDLWEQSGLAKGNAADDKTWGPVSIPSSHGKVIQISAGDSHTVALTQLGAIWAWGTFRDGSGVFGFSPTERIALLPTLVHEPTIADAQAVKISSGADYVMALTRGGVLLSWGTGQQGQLGRVGSRMRNLKNTLLRPHPVPFTRRIRGIGATKVVDFACGEYSSFALAQGGHVFAWGVNNYGQLAFPGKEPVLAPVLVKALEGREVTLIRPGQHHTLFLTRTGELLSAGRPTYGRLGRPGIDTASDEAVAEPGTVQIENGGSIAGLAAGLAVSGAFDVNGKAWLWGFGTNSQLGKGNDDSDEELPHALAETKRFSGRKVVQLEFGGQHVLLLTASAAGNAAAAPAAAAVPVEAAPAAAEAAPKEGEAAATGEEGAGVDEGGVVEKEEPILAEEGPAPAAEEAGQEAVPMEVAEAALETEEAVPPAADGVTELAPPAAVVKKAKARATARGKGGKRKKAAEVAPEEAEAAANESDAAAAAGAKDAVPEEADEEKAAPVANGAQPPSASYEVGAPAAAAAVEATPQGDKAVPMEVGEAALPAEAAAAEAAPLAAAPRGKGRGAARGGAAKGANGNRKRKAAAPPAEEPPAAAAEPEAASAEEAAATELAGTVFGAAEPAVNGLLGSDVAADVAAVSDALAGDTAVPLP